MITVLPQMHQTAVGVLDCGSWQHCVFSHAYMDLRCLQRGVQEQWFTKKPLSFKRTKKGLISMSWVFSLNFKQLQILRLFMEERICLCFFPISRTAL